MKLNTFILTAGLGLAVIAPRALMATVFATDPTGNWNTSVEYATVGTPFTVGGNPMVITSLGFFDMDAHGLSTPHLVGIYNQARTLLGSVEVRAGTASTLHNGSRWEPLVEPIALYANTTYMLAATIDSMGDPFNVAAPAEVTLGNGFTLAGTNWTYALGATFKYPGSQGTGGRYLFGGNMAARDTDPVPEPGQWAMMAVTALGIAGYAARRVRAKTNVG
jgi:hypothetical protein